MGAVVALFDASLRDVGVDLGGGDVLMAQQLLHHAQVGAAVQHVGGKGVPQQVGRHRLGKARLDAGLTDVRRSG